MFENRSPECESVCPMELAALSGTEVANLVTTELCAEP